MSDIAEQCVGSQWPHRFSVLLACTTFPLIWVGGLVTSYDAGMAVPDWPTTYGYNMFLYPLSTWVTGPWDLFIEHGHRLLGSLVGLLTIALNIVIWRYDDRRWMRYAGIVALLLVVSQGMLGGMRVQLSSTDFARAHGVTGPLFFAFTIALCVMTSPFWTNRSKDSDGENPKTTPAKRNVIDGWLVLGLAYCQLLLGAHLRHPNVDWSPGLFRTFVVFHVIVALLVLIQAIQVAVRSRCFESALRRPAWGLLGLVICQVALGVATWRAKYGWPSFLTWGSETSLDQPFEIATHNTLAGVTILNASMVQAITVTGHVALGSLILAAAVWYATRAHFCFVNNLSRASRDTSAATSDIPAALRGAIQ